MVRTTRGDESIANIEVSDYLYNEDNYPVLCLEVPEVETEPLKKISQNE